MYRDRGMGLLEDLVPSREKKVEKAIRVEQKRGNRT